MSLNHRFYSSCSFSRTSLVFFVLFWVLLSSGAAWAKPVVAWQAHQVVANWLHLRRRRWGWRSQEIREVVPIPIHRETSCISLFIWNPGGS